MYSFSTDGSDWAESEAIIKRFEQAWQEGQRPEVVAFVVRDQPWTRRLLIELIHIDLEFRLKVGDTARVETYLSDFPELAGDRVATLELIAAEYTLRHRKQLEITPVEYCHRFPEFAKELPGHLRLATAETLAPATTIETFSRPEWPQVPDYEIVEPIGRGGMGIVYKARQVSLGRDVALKFLPGEYANDPDRLERFRREARTASGLNHPHICTVHALGDYAGDPFIVMEYVDGQTLKSFAESKPSVEEITRLVSQVAQALAAAHAAGVIHRDIKPENIMARADGYVKVLDFGLARRLPSLARPAPGDTDPGTILGTVAYMSPEQARGHAADSASDIFALGIVLYQLLTGKHPFEAEAALDILQLINTHQPPLPSRVNPEVPSGLDGLVEAMLHKSAPLRPTAIEVAAVITGTGGRRAAITPGPGYRPHVRRERELAALRRALATADAGRGTVLCVAGEPGIGKTTLIDDFLAEVETSRTAFLVARGQCSERLAGTEAFLPVVDALGDSLRGGAGPAVARLLKAVSPSWHALVAPAAPAAPDGAGLAPSLPAMRREFSNFLQELSRLGTVVLFFDDVHWADVSTVDLLAHLGRHCAFLRVLILATYRPTELLLGRHPFLGVKQDLEIKGDCTEISLGFLSRKDVERYLGLAFPGHGFPPEFAGLIHSRTEGSPMFMVDLLRHLSEQGVITEAPGRWELAIGLSEVPWELPESVRVTISRKLERLGEADRRLLAAAAVQGVEFDSAVVAGALQLDAAEVEERLQLLDRLHRLVRLVRESEFPDRALTLRYVFAHALYQQALESELSPTRRAALAAALARNLESHYDARDTEAAAQLAYLWELGRDFTKAARYCSLAARNAARVFAHREAIELAKRGLRLLEGLSGNPDHVALELSLQTMLGLQLQITLGYASREARKAYRRARELCEGLSDTDALFLVLWGLWLATKVRAEYPQAGELAGELDALVRQRNNPDLALQAEQALAVTTLCLGKPTESVEHMRRGAALYNPERHRSHSDLYGQDPGVACKSFGSVALWLLGRPAEAVRLSDEAIRESDSLNQPSSQALANLFASIVHQLRRDGPQALVCADACSAFAGEHGLSFWLAGSEVIGGWARIACGDEEGGLARMRRGIADWLATGSRTYHTYYLALLAEVLAERGQLEESGRVIKEALAMASQTRECWFDAELHRLLGEWCLRAAAEPSPEVFERAETEFCKALEIARKQGAKSLEFRAVLSLCRLDRSAGRGNPSRRRLKELYSALAEQGETADLREVREFLERSPHPSRFG